MNYPDKITIPSDNTELELVNTETNTKTKELKVYYKYIVAKYHIGSIISWSESDFEKDIRKGIIVVPK